MYFHNSFRSLSPALLERHFVRQGAGAQVKEQVRRLVRFRHGNIVDPASYEGLGALDAVFCRNVLIYFSDAMILRVVRLFHEVLAPGGFLFLGPRRVAVAHHRPVHAHPLPGRDGLPEAGGGGSAGAPGGGPAARPAGEDGR